MGEADELSGEEPDWWDREDVDTVVAVAATPKPLVVKTVSPFNTAQTPPKKVSPYDIGQPKGPSGMGVQSFVAALENQFARDIGSQIVALFTTLPLAQRDAVRKRLAKLSK